MTCEKWESKVISWEDRKIIREQPCIDKFDAALLILAESWHIILNKLTSLESGDGSTDGYWPFAMTCLNYLVVRCHTIIYRYYMCFPGARRSEGGTHETRAMDTMGRGVPESDIAAARLMTVELACVNFGLWLEKFDDCDADKFRSRRSSFNVNFVLMDIEWATLDSEGDFQHVWARLSLDRLFPTAKACPNEFRGQALQKKQRSKPLAYFGKWRDVEESVSELDLDIDEENIGWRVLPTAGNPASRDGDEDHVDASSGSSRPKLPEPGAMGMSAAPRETREDWFFPFMRSLVQDLESLSLRVAELESIDPRVTELEDDLSELHSNFNRVRICLEKLSNIIRNIRESQLPEDEMVHVDEETIMLEYE